MIADHGVTTDQLESATGGRVMADDKAATDTLNQAAAGLIAALGWCPWPQRTETLTLDSPGTSVLSLPSTLVKDVATLAVDGAPVPDTVYRWSESGLIEKVHGTWPRGYRRVTIEYTHGKNPEELADLQGVILAIAARRVASPLGQTSVRAGSVSETYSGVGVLMADESAIVGRYALGNGGRGV